MTHYGLTDIDRLELCSKLLAKNFGIGASSCGSAKAGHSHSKNIAAITSENIHRMRANEESKAGVKSTRDTDHGFFSVCGRETSCKTMSLHIDDGCTALADLIAVTWQKRSGGYFSRQSGSF